MSVCRSLLFKWRFSGCWVQQQQQQQQQQQHKDTALSGGSESLWLWGQKAHSMVDSAGNNNNNNHSWCTPVLLFLFNQVRPNHGVYNQITENRVYVKEKGFGHAMAYGDLHHLDHMSRRFRPCYGALCFRITKNRDISTGLPCTHSSICSALHTSLVHSALLICLPIHSLT